MTATGWTVLGASWFVIAWACVCIRVQLSEISHLQAVLDGPAEHGPQVLAVQLGRPLSRVERRRVAEAIAAAQISGKPLLLPGDVITFASRDPKTSA